MGIFGFLGLNAGFFRKFCSCAARTLGCDTVSLRAMPGLVVARNWLHQLCTPSSFRAVASLRSLPDAHFNSTIKVVLSRVNRVLSSLRVLSGHTTFVLLSWRSLHSDCFEFDLSLPVFVHCLCLYLSWLFLSWLFSRRTGLALSLSLLVGLALTNDNERPGFDNPMVIARPLF